MKYDALSKVRGVFWLAVVPVGGSIVRITRLVTGRIFVLASDRGLDSRTKTPYFMSGEKMFGKGSRGIRIDDFGFETEKENYLDFLDL